jgi:hypothetical protein
MPLLSRLARTVGDEPLLCGAMEFGYNGGSKSLCRINIPKGGKMTPDGKFQFAPIEPPAPAAEKKSSAWGSASIALAVVAIILFVAGLFLPSLERVKALPYTTRYDLAMYSDEVLMVSFVLICISPLASLAGIGTGIVGILKKGQNKWAGIIGLILCVVSLAVPLIDIAVHFLAG